MIRFPVRHEGYAHLRWLEREVKADRVGAASVSKKSPLPQSRRHVMIFDEDWDFLSSEFGINPGTGVAVRTIVHAKVMDLKAKANLAFDKIRDEMSVPSAQPGNQVDGK